MLDIMSCSVLWNEMCAHNRNLIFWWVPALQVTLRVIQYSLEKKEVGLGELHNAAKTRDFKEGFLLSSRATQAK